MAFRCHNPSWATKALKIVKNEKSHPHVAPNLLDLLSMEQRVNEDRDCKTTNVSKIFRLHFGVSHRKQLFDLRNTLNIVNLKASSLSLRAKVWLIHLCLLQPEGGHMVLEEHENMTMHFWVKKSDLILKTRKHEIYCTDSHDRALHVEITFTASSPMWSESLFLPLNKNCNFFISQFSLCPRNFRVRIVT